MIAWDLSSKTHNDQMDHRLHAIKSLAYILSNHRSTDLDRVKKYWLTVNTGWPQKSKPLSRIIIKSY